MEKIKIMLVFFISMYSFSVGAQALRKPLKVGDHVPNIIVNHVLNYPVPQLKLNDLKGKLVILDFWSVHCSACIAEMPVMQAYQQQFKDKLQVLLVTGDTKSEIETLIKNSAFFAKVNLPVIYDDKILSELFPATAYGLNVWIDENGIVQYRTNSTSFTSTDIADFLNGGKPSLTSRNDTTKFNHNVPVWLEGNGRQLEHIKYYSYITDALPDDAGGEGRIITDSVTNKLIGVKFINTSVLSLFKYAYDEWGAKTFDTITYNIKDSSKYFPPEAGDTYKWQLQNAVSYELHIPATKSAELFSIMRQDLERYFNLKGEIDTIQKLTYTLSIATQAYNRKTYAGGKTRLTSDSKLIPFKNFLDSLKKLLGVDVIADTNNSFPVNVSLAQISGKKELLNFLQQEGYSLTPQLSSVKLLRITETPDN